MPKQIDVAPCSPDPVATGYAFGASSREDGSVAESSTRVDPFRRGGASPPAIRIRRSGLQVARDDPLHPGSRSTREPDAVCSSRDLGSAQAGCGGGARRAGERACSLLLRRETLRNEASHEPRHTTGAASRAIDRAASVLDESSRVDCEPPVPRTPTPEPPCTPICRSGALCWSDPIPSVDQTRWEETRESA